MGWVDGCENVGKRAGFQEGRMLKELGYRMVGYKGYRIKLKNLSLSPSCMKLVYLILTVRYVGM